MNTTDKNKIISYGRSFSKGSLLTEAILQAEKKATTKERNRWIRKLKKGLKGQEDWLADYTKEGYVEMHDSTKRFIDGTIKVYKDLLRDELLEAL